MSAVKRCTGYRPDPDGTRRTPFRHLAGRLRTAALPKSHTLAPWAPAVMDQGPSSSCVGHANAAAVYTALGAAGDPLDWVPSPDGIYRLARAVDRHPRRDGSLPPLTDDGAEPNQALRGMAEWGVRPMGDRPPDGRYSDADPATINDEPMLGELEEAGETLIVGPYAIASTGAHRLTEICTALANNKPITAAVCADGDKFQSYRGGVLGPLGTALDHYIWIYAYETLPSGLRIPRCRNSWGSKDWGEDGDFMLSPAAVDELGDIVVLDVRRAS